MQEENLHAGGKWETMNFSNIFPLYELLMYLRVAQIWI